MVENVGAAPLLDVPNIVCYCYTTLSILVEGRGYAPLRSACKADKLLLHQPSINTGLGLTRNTFDLFPNVNSYPRESALQIPDEESVYLL